jgi:sec-independent protein translocase protein TatC
MSTSEANPQAPDELVGMSLMEHLEELRSRLIKGVAAFILGTVAAWFLYDAILEILVIPLKQLDVSDEIISDGRLIFTAPTEAFFVRLKVVAFSGLILSLPVLLWQAWRFVTPGLYKKERRYAFPFVLVSMLLFSGGAAFAYATLPMALRVLTAFGGSDLVLLPRASEYLSFVMLVVGAFGLAFEFPLVLLALTLVGVITTDTLRKGRRVAWIVILIVAAVVTPTQDPITLMIMSIPLAILYEATILVARLMRR